LYKNDREFRQVAFLAACDETGFSASRPAGPRKRQDQRKARSREKDDPECNTNPPAARQKALRSIYV
jgi:hypothetical protein